MSGTKFGAWCKSTCLNYDRHDCIVERVGLETVTPKQFSKYWQIIC